MEERVSEVVRQYQQALGITLEQMAEKLTESIEWELTRQAIHSWRRGTSEPKTDLLLQVLVTYEDWRQDFARDCLRAKNPIIFVDRLPEFVAALLEG